MSDAKHVQGLHYALTNDGFTITLFEGPPSPKGKRPRWADAEKILKEVTFPNGDVPDVLEDDGEGENAGPKSVKAFGLMNLLTDRTSQVAGDPAAKLDTMLQYWETFKAGKWRERKASGGRSAKVDATFALAVCRAKGYKDAQVSAVAEKLRQMDKDTLAQVRELPAVKEALEKIRAESDKEVDLDFDL